MRLPDGSHTIVKISTSRPPPAAPLVERPVLALRRLLEHADWLGELYERSLAHDPVRGS